jgi:hydroxymethylbilane synthase
MMAPNQPLRLGTRGSKLARCQSELIAEALKHNHPGLVVETVLIQSQGDQLLNSPLWKIGGKGLFTKEIEWALLEHRVDVAVHSLKDLPTTPTPGLVVAAIPQRESPWDVLLGVSPFELSELGTEEKIGTSSLRRQSFLRQLYPNLVLEDLRGNVPTRLGRLLDGEYCGIILAEAGLNRLGLSAPFQRRLRSDELLPAPGQGALAIQCREDDEQTLNLLRGLHDGETAACVEAERALLQHLGGGCQAPLGAYAEVKDGRLHLTGRIVSPDCTSTLTETIVGSVCETEELGSQLARELLNAGAREWMKNWRLNPTEEETNPIIQAFEEEQKQLPLFGISVIVTREEDSDGPISRALRAQGASPICLPLVKSDLCPHTPDMQKALHDWSSFGWVVITSKRAMESLWEAGLAANQELWHSVKWAAVGPGSAERMRNMGVQPELVSTVGTREGLVTELLQKLATSGKQRVLFPRSNLTEEGLDQQLAQKGVDVFSPIAYATTTQTKHFTLLAQLLMEKKSRVVLFASPSAVTAFAQAWLLIPEVLRFELMGTLVAGSIGPSTSAELKNHGFTVTVETQERTFEGLVSALATSIRGTSS